MGGKKKKKGRQFDAIYLLIFVLNSWLQQNSDIQFTCFPCNLKLHTSIITVWGCWGFFCFVLKEEEGEENKAFGQLVLGTIFKRLSAEE